MLKSWSLWIALVAIVVVSNLPASAEGPGDVIGAVRTSLLTGAPVPVNGFGDNILSCPTCPRLYDNSTICTVNVQAVTLGGFVPNPMQPRDWFVTPGGNVTGFDLFVLNGAVIPQHLNLQFFEGTNSQALGQPDLNGLFRTIGAPLISRIPAWDDPNSGLPGIIRVSVDYTAKTYTLTGLSEDPFTGNTVETPLNGDNGEFLGEGVGRDPITIPGGQAGVQVQMLGEASVCNNGDPKGGPVLAGGGSGTEDGLHMIAVYAEGFPLANCSEFEYSEICKNDGWVPCETIQCDVDADCEAVFGPGAICGGDTATNCDGTPNSGVCAELASIPCTGGDVCNLDRPFFGIALTLYAGPGEDEDGNNQIDTADLITAPAAGSGEITCVTGFIGDNGTPCDCADPQCVCTTGPLYDHDDPPDGDIDLIDWGDFQRCLGNTDDPDCLVHDQDQDGDVDIDDFAMFDDCIADPNAEGCSFAIPPAPVQVKDADVFRIAGVSEGDVVAVLLEGTKSSTEGPLWDPFLRVFDGNGAQISIRDGVGGESDDFERSSFDAYTTVEVPPGSTSLYVGVSTAGQIIKLSAPPCMENTDCVGAGVGVCNGGDFDGAFCSSDAQCPGCLDGMGDPIDCACVGTCGGLEAGFCDMPCDEDADCGSVVGFPSNATCGRLTPGFCDDRVWYDPNDASTIMPLQQGSDAGGYTLCVAVTDPLSVMDSGGPDNQCYVSKHEPDDTLDDATDRGAITNTVFRGAIGDGAFAELGQDVDIYRIELDGDPLPLTQNTRSFTASVKNLAGFGFQTVFDLVLAVYNADGELIATGDQASIQGDLDQTRPQLGVNVCGSSNPTGCQNASSTPGLYYLAVFATDREQFDFDDSDCGTAQGCPPFTVAKPPTILNFPHGTGVAATACSDITPVVGGRSNIPGPRIVGREPPDPNTPPNSAELQCYRVVVSTSTGSLPVTGTDIDESLGADGNDSIPNASTSVTVTDRLAGEAFTVRTLGNGHYGGQQGDVDFYLVPGAGAGDLVSLNIADATQPPGNVDNRIRSFVALYDQEGFIIAEQDYSLEHHDSNLFILDNISDEIAANVASLIPPLTGNGNPLSSVYAMVGIDNGNLLLRENTPFDAAFPGTTLSRRFQTDILQARPYVINIGVLQPLAGNITERVFAVVRRGRDGGHTEPFTSAPSQSRRESFPPLVELNPNTGEVVNLLDTALGATNFFNFREPLDTCQLDPDGCPSEVSAQPIIAYDGTTLFVSVEECNAGAQQCPDVNHPFFKINPNLTPDDTGFADTFGEIDLDDPNFDAVLTGLVELNGFLYALDTTSNRIRFWDKSTAPTASNGGETDIDELTDLSETDVDMTVFDDLDGDLGTDGVSIFIPCFDNGSSAGICKFTPTVMPDGSDATFTFDGVIEDPVTNEFLIPGPRIGGLDILTGGVLMATDNNGPIVEYQNGDAVSAVKLPREFLVERISARIESP